MRGCSNEERAGSGQTKRPGAKKADQLVGFFDDALNY